MSNKQKILDYTLEQTVFKTAQEVAEATGVALEETVGILKELNDEMSIDSYTKTTPLYGKLVEA